MGLSRPSAKPTPTAAPNETKRRQNRRQAVSKSRQNQKAIDLSPLFGIAILAAFFGGAMYISRSKHSNENAATNVNRGVGNEMVDRTFNGEDAVGITLIPEAN